MNGPRKKRIDFSAVSSHFMKALAGTHLYPVTDRHLSGVSHAEQVARLSEAGVKLVQLREKIDAPLKFYSEAEAAMQVAREHGVKIIINDRVDLAMALDADGVHLGQEDMPPEAARRLLGSRAIIGFSTHNLEQARQAAQLPVDYVAIGPIFATSTKKSSNRPIGLQGLERVRKVVGSIPLVAIGGVTAENMALVLKAGADVFAVISDIWKPANQAPTKIGRLLSAFSAESKTRTTYFTCV
jgi:thiamine-phosphate pyrophosphorylase